jgi:hypothetical protein
MPAKASVFSPPHRTFQSTHLCHRLRCLSCWLKVYDLYAELLATSKHPSLDTFRFPRKSIFNTFSAHTLERRRSGFREFLRLLLQILRDGEEIPGLSQLLDLPPEALRPNLQSARQPVARNNPHQSSNTLPTCRHNTGNESSSSSSSSPTPPVPSSSPSSRNRRAHLSAEREQFDRSMAGAGARNLVSAKLSKNEEQKGRGVLGNIIRLFFTFLSVLSGYAVSASRGWVDYSHLSLARLFSVLAVMAVAVIFTIDLFFATRRPRRRRPAPP